MSPDELEVPELPPCFVTVGKDENERRVESEWHPMAVAGWQEVWTSPMRAEFLDADYGGIRMLLALEHDFWTRLEKGRSVTELAAEISRIRKNYGLAPMGRRSLQWTIAQTQETMDRNVQRRQQLAARRVDVIDAEVVEVSLGEGETTALLEALG